VLLATSGRFSSLSKQFQKGIDLAVNAKHGGEIDGRPIKLIQKNTKFDPSTGVTKAKDLLQNEDVDFIAGPLGSNVAAAIKPIVDKDGSTPWVNINSASTTLISNHCSPYFVSVMDNTYQLAHPMGAYTYDNHGKTAVVTLMDYNFGHALADTFTKAYEGAGGTVADTIPVPVTTSDFGPVIDRISKTNADVAFCIYSGSVAANFLKAAKQFGLKDEMAVTGFGLVDSNNLQAAGDAMVGVDGIELYSTHRDTQANSAYIDLYTKHYDGLPHSQDVIGFDGMNLIAYAVSQTGSTDPSDVLPFVRGKQIPDSPRGTAKIDPKTQSVITDLPVVKVNGTDQSKFAIEHVFQNVASPDFGCDLSGTLS